MRKAFRTFPVALVFVIADKRSPLSLESAQNTLYNWIYIVLPLIVCTFLQKNHGTFVTVLLKKAKAEAKNGQPAMKVGVRLLASALACAASPRWAFKKGIGCRILVGNQMILNKSKLIRNLLRLRSEKIFSTMGLGYPAIKFKNKVVGKKIAIQWNGNNS